MDTMKAAQHDAYGPAEVLRTRQVPIPALKPGHALVRVAASSVNGVDIAIRSGGLRMLTGKSFPKGTGRDFAGEILAIDPAETAFKVGDAVWGFIEGFRASPSAAAAEYVLVSLGGLALRPRTIDTVGAAALSGAAAAALGVLRDATKAEGRPRSRPRRKRRRRGCGDPNRQGHGGPRHRPGQHHRPDRPGRGDRRPRGIRPTSRDNRCGAGRSSGYRSFQHVGRRALSSTELHAGRYGVGAVRSGAAWLQCIFRHQPEYSDAVRGLQYQDRKCCGDDPTGRRIG
jgi:hypothetical protein